MKRRLLASLLLSLIVADPALALTEQDRALIDATARNDIEAARRLMAGAAEIVAAFNAKDWTHRVLWLLLGALYVFAGLVCL